MLCRNGHRAGVGDDGLNCVVCGVAIMAAVENSLREYMRHNYPGFGLSHQTVSGRYFIVCKECSTEIEIKSIDRLGCTYNTYVTAILRGTIDRHLAQCDGRTRLHVKAEDIRQVEAGRRRIVVK